MSAAPNRGTGLATLLDLDRRRAQAFVQHPTATSLLGTLLPVVVLASGLALLSRIGVPSIDGAAGGLTLGMLVAGAIAFVSYGVLFSTADASFLRGIGIPGNTIYFERSLRLIAVALVVGAAVTLPYVLAGAQAARAWAIATSVAVLTAGTAAFTYAGAAAIMLDARKALTIGAGISQFDPELGRAAPLVYAPIIPFLAGSAYGALAAAGSAVPWLLTFVAAAVAAAEILIARARFGPVAPRFLPRVTEMGYAPPPEKGGEEFRVGRGVSALLPRRAGAVWVRDAVVAGRRFPWASRVTWPVVIASFFALARWGRDSSTQAWVLAAVGIALVVQGAAIVGLGVLEKKGPRWVDRLAGISWVHRFLGRWAWGFEISLWLLVPVALAWSWWSGQGPAWSWPIAGLFTAAVATAASLLNAERKT